MSFNIVKRPKTLKTSNECPKTFYMSIIIEKRPKTFLKHENVLVNVLKTFIL
jgi:hypothetical protein